MTEATTRPGPPTTGSGFETVESARMVRGHGAFVDDFDARGMLHMALVRSPFAHARITEVDIGEAHEIPGVHGVITAQDVLERTRPIFTLADMSDPPLPIPMYALAAGKVRHVGEGVAAVAATSREVAEDACRRIVVDYEPFEPIPSLEAATTAGAPLIHEGLGSNVAMHRKIEWGDPGAAFDRATHVVRRTMRWGRHSGAALDTFGVVAAFNPGRGELTYWSNSQSNALLWTLGDTLGLPTHKVEGIPRDVGGAFGGKFWVPRNMVLVGMFAMETGRHVKYIEDRWENLIVGDNHGEDRYYDAELALDTDGGMLGMRFRVVEDYGAYFLLGPATNSSPLAQATGPYRIPSVGVDFSAVLTNKTNQGAYRGLGASPMTMILERLVDAAADRLGLPRDEIRRRNFIQPDEFPFKTPIGNIYDSGDYPAALERALEFGRVEEWRRYQLEARARGRYVGIGLATTQERSVPSMTELWVLFENPGRRPTTSAETVTCRIDSHGHLSILLHSPSLGTSPETVAVMVASEELGIDPGQIVVDRLTTRAAGPAMGPAGSRMTVMTSGALNGALLEIKQKLVRIAAHLLEAAPEDVVYDPVEAGCRVRGAPGSIKTLPELALIANTASLLLPPGESSGLESTHTYDHPMATMPGPDGDWGSFNPIMGHSVHMPVVEVDIETGLVSFLDYAVVHDCGTVLNPPAVRGQILGGICQGIGSALYEEFVYDESGTPLNGSFATYLMPTFAEMPRVRIEHMVTPSPFTYKGMKGTGEGGRIGAPAAIASAIEDALAPLGVVVDQVPMTAERLLGRIKEAQATERRG